MKIMRNQIKYFIKFKLEKFLGFLVKKREIRNLISNSDFFIGNERLAPMFGILNVIKSNRHHELIQNFSTSKSQFGQDLFVIAALDFTKNGFFVEFGAADGKELSNTYILEKFYKWNGVLAEPALVWHKHLSRNRSAIIETKCVYEKSGTWLEFHESVDYAILSGLFVSNEKVEKSRKYKVETISLLDLLIKTNAPTVIDYLSIDTEGSELAILEAFDFAKYDFKIITVEHNFRKETDEILKLLKNNGYIQVFSDLSGIEGWFINSKFQFKNLLLSNHI